LFRSHGGAKKCYYNGSDLGVLTSSGGVLRKAVEEIGNTYNADIAAITKSEDGDRRRPSELLEVVIATTFFITSQGDIGIIEMPGSGFMIASKMR
jgi:hypothetical protein